MQAARKNSRKGDTVDKARAPSLFSTYRAYEIVSTNTVTTQI